VPRTTLSFELYCEFRLYLGVLTNCINRPLTIFKSLLTIAQTPIIVLKRDISQRPRGAIVERSIQPMARERFK